MTWSTSKELKVIPFLEEFELFSSSGYCSEFEVKLTCLLNEVPLIGVAQGFDPLKAALLGVIGGLFLSSIEESGTLLMFPEDTGPLFSTVEPSSDIRSTP